jgi:hypothetical protein
MLGSALNYSGLGWPDVRVIGSAEMMVKFVAPADKMPLQPNKFFDLAVTGKPRPWSTNVATAIWRDLADAAGDSERLLAFVAKWGDPLNKLSPDHPVRDSDWFGLRGTAAMVAKAWRPEDHDGISHVGNPQQIKDTEGFLAFSELEGYADQFTVIPDPNGKPDYALRANTLAGFLFGSMVSELRRRVPMRRCRTCNGWFELPRKDALYCSGRCRMAQYIAKQGGKS